MGDVAVYGVARSTDAHASGSLAWIPQTFIKQKKPGLRGGKVKYELVEYPDDFKKGVKAVMQKTISIVSEVFDITVKEPNIIFDKKRIVSKMDFAAAQYWSHNNTIEIRGGFYDVYLRDGKKFDSWVTFGMAHELSHAFIDNFPYRRIDPNSPLAEGTSDMVGIYVSRRLRGEPIDRHSIAASAAEEVKRQCDYVVRELNGLIRDIDSTTKKVTVEYAISVIEGQTKELKNYTNSKLYIAKRLISEKEVQFGEFIRSVVGTARDPLGVPIDQKAVRELVAINAKRLLRGSKGKGVVEKEVFDAVKVKAKELIQEATDTRRECVSFLNDLAAMAAKKTKSTSS